MEIKDLTGLGQLADSQLINKLYDDGLSGGVREAGTLITDLAKTLNLLMIPIQLLGLVQDRLRLRLENVRSSVPENQRVAPKVSVSIPVIQKAALLDDDDKLLELYLNLLRRAIDRDRANEACDAYVTIISQLMPDEAMILHVLKAHGQQCLVEESKQVEGGFPLSLLMQPKHLLTYSSHLIDLSLVSVVARPMPKIDVEKVKHDQPYSFRPGSRSGIKMGSPRYSMMMHRKEIVDLSSFNQKPELGKFIALSPYGELFAKACVPESLPESNKQQKEQV